MLVDVTNWAERLRGQRQSRRPMFDDVTRIMQGLQVAPSRRAGRPRQGQDRNREQPYASPG